MKTPHFIAGLGEATKVHNQGFYEIIAEMDRVTLLNLIFGLCADCYQKVWTKFGWHS